MALSDGWLNLSSIVATSSGILTSDILLQSTDDTNVTDLPSSPVGSANESQAMQYIIIPLGILSLLCLLAVMVYFIIRKKRLDRLRHHLIPLYNFDPTEEGEDWDVELLEEGVDHHSMHWGVLTLWHVSVSAKCLHSAVH
ncbi:small integral membrane protein 29-like [Cryptotermes secundus]|uniref:small integral membrane protein 29-like n=1 Tax=Cryptotermes secundus TaxID=105785 RepID=UPI001454BF14|nr:small integral membrane protein 29-like [Cryptotermes secundus]